ncbi:MAG: Uncharacterised protein [Hyphomonas sp. TMED17]|nr:MAG: Uncharacterised protein [Hyphomonas sp. TMED17]
MSDDKSQGLYGAKIQVNAKILTWFGSSCGKKLETPRGAVYVAVLGVRFWPV